jgi:two-component system sensor histidine kinase KdpD
MVCLSSAVPSEFVLRRGWRIAHRLQADIVAVYVSAAMPTINQMKVLDKDFKLATSLNIPIQQVRAKDIAQALSDYAVEHHVTQIVIGHSNRSQSEQIFHGSIINKLLDLVTGIDVLIVATATKAR